VSEETVEELLSVVLVLEGLEGEEEAEEMGSHVSTHISSPCPGCVYETVTLPNMASMRLVEGCEKRAMAGDSALKPVTKVATMERTMAPGRDREEKVSALQNVARLSAIVNEA